MKGKLLAVLLVALLALHFAPLPAEAAPVQLDVPLTENFTWTLAGNFAAEGNVTVVRNVFLEIETPTYITVTNVYAAGAVRVRAWVNGTLVYDSQEQQPVLGYVLAKPSKERLNVTVVEEYIGVASGDMYHSYMLMVATYNVTGQFEGSVLTVTLKSPYKSAELYYPPQIKSGEAYPASPLIVLKVGRIVKVESELPVAYTEDEVRYSDNHAPARPNTVKVYLEPAARQLPALKWRVKYPSGEEREHVWAASGDLLLGTSLTLKSSEVDVDGYTGAVAAAFYFLNGTGSAEVKPAREGFYNLTVIWLPTVWYPANSPANNMPVPSGVLFVFKHTADLHVFKLALLNDDAPEGVVVRYAGQAPAFDISISFGNYKVSYPGVAELFFNVTVKGVKHSPVLSKNYTSHVAELKPGLAYTVVNETGTRFNRVVIVGGSGSAYFTSPLVAEVTVRDSFAIIADSPKPVIKAYTGGRATTFAGNIVPTRVDGTYEVKLAANLKVVNVYQGKKIEATVEVLKDSVTIARSRGTEVEFTLEPLQTYTVRGDNGNEVVSVITTVLDDDILQLVYAKPPAFFIPLELIIAVLLLLIVLLLAIAVVRGFKLGIEVK
ncbi:MAG: hypothetical protein QXU60_06075 [Sulfolobales archaeon]